MPARGSGAPAWRAKPWNNNGPLAGRKFPLGVRARAGITNVIHCSTPEISASLDHSSPGGPSIRWYCCKNGQISSSSSGSTSTGSKKRPKAPR